MHLMNARLSIPFSKDKQLHLRTILLCPDCKKLWLKIQKQTRFNFKINGLRVIL